MKSHGGNVPFDEYRRERNQRRAQSGPLRPIAKGQEVLREIEEAESRDIQEQRLTREVHDFFADATRTAASIVKRVTELEVQSTKTRLTDEVEEFLRVTISRAQAFINMLHLVGATPEAERLVEAQMHNIVGTMLDEFRSEGTAQIEDKHFGQDPLDTSLAEVMPQKRATPASGITPAAGKSPSQPAPGEADHRGIEEHLVAELNRNAKNPGATGNQPHERAKGTNVGSDNATAQLLLSRIGDDPAKMKAALKAMVKNEVITRAEAQQIWAEFRQKSS